jgi:hypothetical protein
MFIIDWVLDKFGYVNKASIVFSIPKPCKKVATKKKTVAKKSPDKRRLG